MQRRVAHRVDRVRPGAGGEEGLDAAPLVAAHGNVEGRLLVAGAAEEQVAAAREAGQLAHHVDGADVGGDVERVHVLVVHRHVRVGARGEEDGHQVVPRRPDRVVQRHAPRAVRRVDVDAVLDEELHPLRAALAGAERRGGEVKRSGARWGGAGRSGAERGGAERSEAERSGAKRSETKRREGGAQPVERAVR